MKQLPHTALTILLLSLVAPLAHAASYTTSWLGNSGGTATDFVGNGARSLWVSPEGIAYTASMWDEKGRNIGAYQNGAVIGAMGGTNASQGSAIGGDEASIFTAQQSPNGGKIGRYNRTTGKRDLLFQASVSHAAGDVITGIAVSHGLVYVSDFVGNRVCVFTIAGVPRCQWAVPEPGAIAVENDGQHLWVARKSTGEIRRYGATGGASDVIRLGASARPSALHVNAQGELWIGDQGPDMNIKIYTGLDAQPVQSGTFGITGGYLSATGGQRGEVGPLRFTRVVGIGSDKAGHVYILNNPWGGTSDLGRDGGTDLQCYDRATSALVWTQQAINFESAAAPDPGTDGRNLYSGNIIYSGSGQAGYKANTVDPFRYPGDPRIDTHTRSRGEHFGMLACVDGHRILIACGQNPDVVYSYHFNPATDGLIAIPGQVFGRPHPLRSGFDLASNGDIWTSLDKTKAIQHYPLTGFAPDGTPIWGAAISTPIPTSIGQLNRLTYLPETDTMVLANSPLRQWVVLGNRIEVYHHWQANAKHDAPDVVIPLTRAVGKSLTAAGAYLFVGYYAVPNVDVFDLATGSLVLTMTANDGVAPGNDTDSMYGIRAFKKSDGTYLVTKDDYNHTKLLVFTFTP